MFNKLWLSFSATNNPNCTALGALLKYTPTHLTFFNLVTWNLTALRSDVGLIYSFSATF